MILDLFKYINLQLKNCNQNNEFLNKNKKNPGKLQQTPGNNNYYICSIFLLNGQERESTLKDINS